MAERREARWDPLQVAKLGGLSVVKMAEMTVLIWVGQWVDLWG